MKISIVTINYNGSEDTIKLLKSFKEQSPHQSKHGVGQADTDFEIIVVDNASEEADFANLQTGINQLIHSFPLPTFNVGHSRVKVVKNSENLGFSGGNNVGIRQALQNGASWVVLLNNDTWVERDFAERFKGVLSTKTGVLGIPLIEGDGVAYFGKVQWLKPTLVHMTDIQCRSVDKSQVYAIGGAVAFHKDVFEKIGFLDEKYFLYFEDADFSIRARKVGFDISIAENLNVHHHVSSSTKKLGSPLLLRYHYRNALYFNLKNGPWYVKLLVWPWSWLNFSKQIIKIVINKEPKTSKAILLGIIDFYLGKFGKIE